MIVTCGGMSVGDLAGLNQRVHRLSLEERRLVFVDGHIQRPGERAGGTQAFGQALVHPDQYVVGAGYVDDCFVLAANYVTSYNYSAGVTPPVLSHAFMLQIGLRTLANSSSTAGGGGGGVQ